MCVSITPASCGEPVACAAKINAALLACSAAGGGTVQLSAGTFKIGAMPSAAPSSLFKWHGLQNTALIGAPLGADGLPKTLLEVQELHGGFSIAGSYNVRIERISLDLARPPFTLGRVATVNAHNFTTLVDPQLYPFPPSSSWLRKVTSVMALSLIHI